MKRILFLILFLAAVALPTRAQVYKSNSQPLGGNLFTQDAGTCSTTGSFLWQVLPNNAGTTTVNLAGTFSATLTVRESNNGGGTWSTAGTISAAGTTTYSTNGFTDFCVDLTTFTSGNVQVSISTGLLQVQSVVSGGGTGGLTPVTSLPGTCTPGTTQPVILTVAPYKVYYCSSSNVWSLIGTGAFLNGSIIDAGDPQYGLVPDAVWVIDATFNGTSTVTTGASDPCFVKTGAQIEGTTWNGVDSNYPTSTLALAETTIATVNSCHSAVVTSGTPATCSAACTLGWGTKNDTAIAAIWTAAVGNPGLCKSIWWPSGGMWLDSTQWNVSSVACNWPITGQVRQGLQFMGQGGHEGGTTFVIGSTFNLSACTTDCFFHGLAGIKLSSFSIFGLGSPSLTGTFPTDLIGTGLDTEIDDIELAGILASQGNDTCIALNNIDVRWLIIDGCGGYSTTSNHVGMHQSFFGNTIGDTVNHALLRCGSSGGWHTESHGTGYSLNSASSVGILANNGCNYVSQGDVFVQGIPTNGVCIEALTGGVVDLIGFTCEINGGTTTTALWAHGGKIIHRSSQLGGSSQASLADNTTGLIIDATPGLTIYSSGGTNGLSTTSPACTVTDERFVGCANLTAQAANIGATTLYTTPSFTAYGSYRLDYDLEVVVAGTSGTLTVNLICPNGAATFTQPGAQTIAVTATAGSETSGSIACHATTSSAVQYSVTGITTAGSLSYTLILRLVAQ